MDSAATISECGRYRYDLIREWEPVGLWAMWIMLNPSTADAEKDDPTIRRCIGFSKQAGYAGLVVCNLYAWRATDPAALVMAGTDAIGPQNAHTIEIWMRSPVVDRVICAWGAWPGTLPRVNVAELAARRNRPLWCLGKTKSGAPRHPLYVKSSQSFELLSAINQPSEIV